MKTAIFGAGCFWGVQLAFDQLEGVEKTRAGYIGGELQNPTYRQVCQGDSGHAEVVEITYDESVISYSTLLTTFWTLHDPTQVDRQGVDIGKQYRSAIFYTDESQRQAAEQAIQQLTENKAYAKPIATEVTAASTFYEAEEYHQDYLVKNGLSSCTV
ncbi:peptide-methionine (S)-S-oxide reductase MsrA [Marinicella sp. W31]|uniref:peptide-methionine (S)-S-oxide reductase MsrA n=1 Tax=Marinicella sp. W31 TaxID=3023713 RepID=UPI0037567AA3